LVGAGAAAAGVELFEDEDDELLDDELDPVFEGLEVVAVLFLVVVAVCFWVVAALVAVFEEVSGVATTAVELFAAGTEVSAEAPASAEILLDPNCGGVIERTAPRPPTVPPAINNARFMPYTSSFPLNF